LNPFIDHHELVNYLILMEVIKMNINLNQTRIKFAAIAMTASLLAGSTSGVFAIDHPVKLTGKQEGAGIVSSPSGKGSIFVDHDQSIRGSITTSDFEATSAHIHESKGLGQTGPVIITLKETAPNVWSVPVGAKLTDKQYKSYQDGNLYINIHSAMDPKKEIHSPVQ
jgi:hypothetical protein